MRILLLCHAFNSLGQRLFVELRQRDHTVSVEYDIHDSVTLDAVERFRPDLVVAPFLKRAIPEAVWRETVCLIVHPGIVGDRGPSALDWAILNREQDWGVTVLQANAEMDAGPVWATAGFAMRDATKSSLYRHEVTDAAVRSVLQAVERYEHGGYTPLPPDDPSWNARGELRPLMRQPDRAIDWRADDTETVVRKIRSADGFPGVADALCGREVFLYDARPELSLTGEPGELLARCGPAVARATTDGAVWIGHLREQQGPHPFKLPAAQVLANAITGLPEAPGYSEIEYEEADGVGYLHFPFYNGAMGTEQCERLLAAYREACSRDTRVIVLMGGPDFWSNGMHLNRIEAAESPSDESWYNINAIDDLAEAIIRTESHLTVSALQGNAGAGGVFLARAADAVWARSGVILSPHYKDMGNLYGSEFWTYLLPRCAGDHTAERIAQARLPMGCAEARDIALIDDHFGEDPDTFVQQVRSKAAALANGDDFAEHIDVKRRRREADERERPLSEYREQELAKMRLNFYGFDPSYHVARYNFVYRVPKSHTPLTLALHRGGGHAARLRKVS